MKKGSILLIMTVVAISLVAFPGCKKNEQKNPEAHMKEMMQRSFEESRKAIALNVNGEPVTMFTLLREMNATGSQYLAAGKQRTPELEQQVRKDSLNIVIVQTLAVQEAKKRGMKVKPEIMDAEIKRLKANAGSQNVFDAYLAGMSDKDLRKMVEQDALFEMIATEEVDNKIPPASDAAVKARYKKDMAGLKDANHRQMSFEAAKGMVVQKLREEAARKRMQAWEKELKKNAKIEIVDKKLQTADAK